MDRNTVLKEIVSSNISEDVKVYLINLVTDNSENRHLVPINESILDPESSWGKKGTEEYKSFLEYYGH